MDFAGRSCGGARRAVEPRPTVCDGGASGEWPGEREIARRWGEVRPDVMTPAQCYEQIREERRRDVEAAIARGRAVRDAWHDPKLKDILRDDRLWRRGLAARLARLGVQFAAALALEHEDYERRIRAHAAGPRTVVRG